MNKRHAIRNLAMATAAMLLLASAAAWAQTATGVINGTLINKSGISLVFDTDPAGVALGNSGTSAATLNFGNISAFGALSGGVVRTSVTAANFTVQTPFFVNVIQGGGASTSYTLTANLAGAAATGFSYVVDAVTLTTTAQTIQVNGAYGTDVLHNLGLVVSTAAPAAGGPVVGTPVTATINFTATPN